MVQKIEALNLENSVKLLSWQKDVAQYMKNCMLLIQVHYGKAACSIITETRLLKLPVIFITPAALKMLYLMKKMDFCTQKKLEGAFRRHVQDKCRPKFTQ